MQPPITAGSSGTKSFWQNWEYSNPDNLDEYWEKISETEYEFKLGLQRFNYRFLEWQIRRREEIDGKSKKGKLNTKKRMVERNYLQSIK